MGRLDLRQCRQLLQRTRPRPGGPDARRCRGVTPWPAATSGSRRRARSGCATRRARARPGCPRRRAPDRARSGVRRRPRRWAPRPRRGLPGRCRCRSPAGWSRLATTRAAACTDSSVRLSTPLASATSSGVGSRCRSAGELPGHAIGALSLLRHLHGDADGVAVLLDGPLQGLADPPRGVGRESETALPVELVDGAHEPEGPLLDEVAEVDAPVLVATRPVDDEAQVGGDHLATGLVVAGRDALGQLDLLLVVRQGVAVEIIQKEPDTVVCACRVRHRSSSS